MHWNVIIASCPCGALGTVKWPTYPPIATACVHGYCEYVQAHKAASHFLCITRDDLPLKGLQYYPLEALGS